MAKTVQTVRPIVPRAVRAGPFVGTAFARLETAKTVLAVQQIAKGYRVASRMVAFAAATVVVKERCRALTLDVRPMVLYAPTYRQSLVHIAVETRYATVGKIARTVHLTALKQLKFVTTGLITHAVDSSIVTILDVTETRFAGKTEQTFGTI